MAIGNEYFRVHKLFFDTIPIKKTKKPFQRWGKDEQTQIEKLFTIFE